MVRLGLADLRLDHALVEAEQHAVLFDEVALLEGDLDDLPIDARLDGDIGERLDRARCNQDHRHVGFGRPRPP
jgi:hypothetical protein